MQNETGKPKEPVRLDLTDEQRRQIKQQTGHDAATIELAVEELEERIAPRFRAM